MKKFLLAFLIAAAPFCVFAQLPSYLPTDSLVGWWPFNGNAIDESVNSNDGTVNGATLTNDRFGIANAAYSFNGIANSILVPSVFYDISVSHSISMWVSINDLTLVGQYLWNTSNHTGEAFVYNWGAYNNNVLYCLGNGTSWSITCGTEQTFLTATSNIWYLYTMTYSSGVWSIFINGQLADTYTSTNLPTGVTSLVFGDIAMGGEALNGKLDDIGIWNRALTPEEITALYTGVPNNSGSGNTATTTVPAGISYQAIARNAQGQPLSDTDVQVKFTLLTDSLTGAAEYSESHSLTTNSLGLFTTAFGAGTPLSDTFANINWASGSKYLNVELDAGSGFVDMGSQQLLTVPYSMRSNTSAKAGTIENAGLPVYADNTAALAGGLLAGQMYRTPGGVLMIVY
jgi:hypothetical protein